MTNKQNMKNEVEIIGKVVELGDLREWINSKGQPSSRQQVVLEIEQGTFTNLMPVYFYNKNTKILHVGDRLQVKIAFRTNWVPTRGLYALNADVYWFQKLQLIE